MLAAVKAALAYTLAELAAPKAELAYDPVTNKSASKVETWSARLLIPEYAEFACVNAELAYELAAAALVVAEFARKNAPLA